MPIATTYDAIRSGIVTAIRGISPTYAPSSSNRWRPVDQQRDVPSMGLRTFYVELIDIVETGEIYGGCALHSSDLYVWTSYGGMPQTDADIHIARDQQDLWRALHRAEIDGAPRFEKQPWQQENDDGRHWGAHVFSTSLFLPLP